VVVPPAPPPPAPPPPKGEGVAAPNPPGAGVWRPPKENVPPVVGAPGVVVVVVVGVGAPGVVLPAAPKLKDI
jgi:hypothetical protein